MIVYFTFTETGIPRDVIRFNARVAIPPSFFCCLVILTLYFQNLIITISPEFWFGFFSEEATTGGKLKTHGLEKIQRFP